MALRGFILVNLLVGSIATSSCGTDNCLQAAQFSPHLRSDISSLCEKLIHSTPGIVTRTQTSTLNVGVTTNLPPTVVTTTTTTTATPTSLIGCTKTVTATGFTTSVGYPTRGTTSSAIRRDEGPLLTPRDNDAALINQCNQGCDGNRQPILDRFSSACKCYLTSGTTFTTSTITNKQTVTGTAATSTQTVTSTVNVSVNPCGSSTVTTFTCGITFSQAPTRSTSGQVTCPNTSPTPSTNARLRIEGGTEGTIFEDCIEAGPRNITTPSGGTHACDGTNLSANPNPGTTPTDQLDAAGMRNGFAYDGTYDSQFQDFFVTSIAETTQTSNQFWGLAVNFSFTSTGGCQTEISYGDQSLWAFDAFSKNSFLSVFPQYAVAQAAQGSVAVTIRDGMNGQPLQGISFSDGSVSDANGAVTVPIPMHPGCYQYKATDPNYIRSDAFYLTVIDHF